LQKRDIANRALPARFFISSDVFGTSGDSLPGTDIVNRIIYPRRGETSVKAVEAIRRRRYIEPLSCQGDLCQQLKNGADSK